MAHRYGLIGRNIDYSFSRKYFTEKFRALHLDDHSYINFDLPQIEDFPEVIRDSEDLTGLNVTIPYKEAILPYLDHLDPVARNIGAVNTIRIHQGKLTGYNTDAHGFEKSLAPYLRPHIRRALVLGTGGASKAVEFILERSGLNITRVSRTRKPGTITYHELNEEVISSHHLIVNCTPLGTFPNISSKPDIPYQFLTSGHLLYDLIYNPEQTAFLKEGARRGCSTVNGYQMLVLQAEKAWEIWNQ